MIEKLKYLVDLVGGKSNALTILGTFVSLFSAFYFYFRTFYRLVFSASRVCKKGIDVKNWKDEQNQYLTCVVFYNNGRKTFTSAEITQLEIISSKDILSVRFLEDCKNVKFVSTDHLINIEIEYLDASKFFVLEIEHKCVIDVQGRISETGEMLPIEPKYWIAINIIFMIYFLLLNI